MQPWETEPNQWLGEGMVAWRHPDSGHWCGYVAIPRNHPWMRVVDGWGIDTGVHGGVTWLESDLPGRTRDALGPDFWADFSWVGFDCHHHNDYAPYYKYHDEKIQEYRDLEYVKTEILKLARQAMEARRESF